MDRLKSQGDLGDRALARTTRWLTLGLFACPFIFLILLRVPSLGVSTRLESLFDRSYAKGDTIELPRSTYSSSRTMIAVYGTSFCPASRSSAPFLRHLFRTIAGDAGTRSILVPTSSLSDYELQFAADIGLSPHDIIEIPRPIARIKLVPTVIVVDRTGRILFVREGALDSAAVDVLLAVLSSGGL